MFERYIDCQFSFVCRFTWSGFHICDIKCWSCACHHRCLCPRQHLIVRLRFKPSPSVAVRKAIGTTSANVQVERLFGRYQFWHEICPQIFRCAWNWRRCTKPNEFAQQSCRTKGIWIILFTFFHRFILIKCTNVVQLCISNTLHRIFQQKICRKFIQTRENNKEELHFLFFNFSSSNKTNLVRNEWQAKGIYTIAKE